MIRKINGILLIYHHPPMVNASTIKEHISAFEKYSQFEVFTINTLIGFPKFLKNFEFSIIVLHYSLFGLPISLDKRFWNYIQHSKSSYKIAFLQDEHRYWPERADFLNKCNVDCVYSLLEKDCFKDTYQKKTKVKEIIHNIPGYVSSEINENAQKYYKPDYQRTIDVGYRGRRLPYYNGRASQEKHFIGVEFKKRAAQNGIITDIETEENKRIYGDDWYLFLANCKAVLGVEAGVSVFDIDDEVRPRYAKMVKGNPDVSFPENSFEDVYNQLLKPYEDKIYYRTISPRHFEASAFRNCQILFEGKYSGIMKPMVHYIPLKKDFSNYDTVIQLFKNKEIRKKMTENAYRDLIRSGKYTYGRFIEGFDNRLLGKGLIPDISPAAISILRSYQKREDIRMLFHSYFANIRYADFPGRKLVKFVLGPIVRRLRI